MMWLPASIDHHTLAVISVIGSSLDVLGALYLAYDLLGGEHGPLRILTRAVTYGALSGVGFGLALGPIFGLVTGVAHGATLAWEFGRASRHQPKQGFWVDTAMSAIRGFSYTVGAWYLFGPAFGITFGALSTVGQVIAYSIGIRPTAQYKPSTRPRLTRFVALTALNRTVGYSASGYVSSLIAGQSQHAIAIGLRTGLTIGVVTAILTTCSPFIEWKADHVPEKAMGVSGIALILLGFTLQSVQYWVTLLDVAVR